MIHRQILACLSLLILIPLSAKAFPPASPAGGNYLVLRRSGRLCGFRLKAFGVLFPKDTDEFTVEAWVYPTTPPAENIHATILSQQVGRCYWTCYHRHRTSVHATSTYHNVSCA